MKSVFDKITEVDEKIRDESDSSGKLSGEISCDYCENGIVIWHMSKLNKHVRAHCSNGCFSFIQ